MYGSEAATVGDRCWAGHSRAYPPLCAFKGPVLVTLPPAPNRMICTMKSVAGSAGRLLGRCAIRAIGEATYPIPAWKRTGVGRSRVPARAGGKPDVIGRRWAVVHRGRTGSTLRVLAARYRRRVLRTGQRRAA